MSSRDGLVRSSKRIIRVTPTLNNGVAYAAGDVAFTATEIPRAVIGLGGCSKIVNCFIMDQDRDTYDLNLVFSEGNTALGTINATADISDANNESVEPMLIQAASDSTSVYVSGIITDGTPTFAAADDIDIILHIED